MENQINEVKLWIINILVLSVSFTNVEVVLKIASLFILIGYNLHKWYLMIKKKNNETN
jgi:hypothetical protein